MSEKMKNINSIIQICEKLEQYVKAHGNAYTGNDLYESYKSAIDDFDTAYGLKDINSPEIDYLRTRLRQLYWQSGYSISYEEACDIKHVVIQLKHVLLSDNEYNTYHLLKSFSICQLFLEKDKEKELDEKLPQFLDTSFGEDERREKAKLLRQIRNKIAHGDYKQFTERVEKYAESFMDGRFWFDYSEYSRQNWVLLNICCELDDAIRKMLYLLFTERQELDRIKGSKA